MSESLIMEDIIHKIEGGLELTKTDRFGALFPVKNGKKYGGTDFR